jgi:hypothetical protein
LVRDHVIGNQDAVMDADSGAATVNVDLSTWEVFDFERPNELHLKLYAQRLRSI